MRQHSNSLAQDAAAASQPDQSPRRPVAVTLDFKGARHRRSLQRIRSGWRRRASATGVLLAVIAVTVVWAG